MQIMPCICHRESLRKLQNESKKDFENPGLCASFFTNMVAYSVCTVLCSNCAHCCWLMCSSKTLQRYIYSKYRKHKSSLGER